MKPTLPENQSAFSAALLQPDAPVPENVVDPQGRVAPKRFAVYRNNVTVSLVEALRATFKSVEALVGEAFFKQMAREFVRSHPPKSPLLMEYGREFAAFVSNFRSAENLPFLADVARLDRAWLDAYHAADAEPLGQNVLGAVEPEKLAELRFGAHPAMRLVPSAFPLVAIWEAGRAGDLGGMADDAGVQWALVSRPDVRVMVTALTPLEGNFFLRLRDGRRLGEAAEMALGENEHFDFARALGLVMSTGAFTLGNGE